MRKTVFVDSRISAEALLGLERRGFFTVTLPPYNKLGEAVKAHTDMLLLRADNDYFTYADYVEAAPYVFDELYTCKRPRIHFVSGEVNEKYPNDCGLNVLIMGKHAFLNPRSTNPYVYEYLKTNGYSIREVRQGYPACTALKLNCESAITADVGMARALREAHMRVTLISEGGILLPPHEYGFIGGTAGVTDGTVYFNGNIERHPSAMEIKEAIENEGLKYVSLANLPLADVGGLLFAD